jgi:hypothetical protein
VKELYSIGSAAGSNKIVVNPASGGDSQRGPRADRWLAAVDVRHQDNDIARVARPEDEALLVQIFGL